MRNVTAWVALVGALGCAAPVALAEAPDDSALQRAYRKEFAFLEAEKRALEERLANITNDGEQKLRQGEAEVQHLSGQVMGLTMQGDALAESLADAERESDVVSEGDDLIEATLTQAAAALDKGGLKLEKVAEDDAAGAAKQLSGAFDGALRLLDDYGQVRVHDGEYFGKSGTKLKGKVIEVGNIAAFGVGEQSGALAPAGGGHLKLFDSALGVTSAKALAEGESTPTLGIFLYETLEKNFEPRKDKTALEVIEAGGVIAWVIAALGVVALLMLLVRVVILARNSANADKWVSELAPLVKEGKYEAAAAQCEKSKNSPARVLAVTLRNLRAPREQLDDLVSEQILAEAPLLDRFGQMILVFAAVAPLLGLLGTVTGMISTFDIITEFGTGNPKLLSGGISEALITTELGLVVAIPALLGGNLLGAWGERIKADMDRASLRLTNIAYGKSYSTKATSDADDAAPAADLAPAE